jgi:hypothetical protein
MGVIAGTGAAFIGVTETTGKGGLHFHVGEFQNCSTISILYSLHHHNILCPK